MKLMMTLLLKGFLIKFHNHLNHLLSTLSYLNFNTNILMTLIFLKIS